MWRMKTAHAVARVLCVVSMLALTGALQAAAPRADVMVFAAASLKEALDEQIKQYQARVGIKVTVSYSGSSMLARQIESGAPADLFISADLEWMDYLERKKAIRAGSRLRLLTSSLVLIAPARSPVRLLNVAPGFALAQALGDGRLAMADPDSVPAGKYGRAALESLGVWREVAAKTVRAENVRAALAYVARGATPLGIVYRTDALAEPGVRIVGEFPAGSHPEVVYPAALVAGRNSPHAEALLRYLGSADARDIWRKHGFVTEN